MSQDQANPQELRDYIRSIPGFPKEGIIFRDITTLLNNKDAFKIAINELAKPYLNKKIDYIVAVEARGFMLGGALAYKLGCGFVPVRKKGKLPYKTFQATYDLEYGTDTLEIHQDAITPGASVLIIDDLLATGGTARAVVELIEKLNGEVVGICFLIELADLKGSEKLQGYPVHCLIRY